MSLDFDRNQAVKYLVDNGMDANGYMPARVYETPAGLARLLNIMIEEVREVLRNYITRQTILVNHPEIGQIRTALGHVHDARHVGK
jgi:hypothetical protein